MSRSGTRREDECGAARWNRVVVMRRGDEWIGHSGWSEREAYWRAVAETAAPSAAHVLVCACCCGLAVGETNEKVIGICSDWSNLKPPDFSMRFASAAFRRCSASINTSSIRFICFTASAACSSADCVVCDEFAADVKPAVSAL